ncbi:helix-turn-helix domain-containing protein [Saccharopolyspora sp. K220]|uniref:helix-turn-helix domain-containing protein n=1 Tax=Saccharopolyspora soli TaxID=2926618 RepID=UPI001F57F73F|nr:helix-turn-helix domain-containing protein [Saccharopolyspora soli]MCI2422509.1 helix-turn-helix domain-containing protein [Saccharopolyspora soli]
MSGTTMRNPDFGNTVRLLRLRRKMTQPELADAVNVTKFWISKIEHGTVPHPNTVAALDSVLGAENNLINQARRARTELSAHLRHTAQLPSAPPLIYGRRHELGALHSELAPHHRTPIRVLTGPAGIGKTGLAVTWAHDATPSFPDGVLYSRLHGHTPGRAPATAHDVLADLISGLGVTDLPNSQDAREALLKTLLADKKVLLVLDDADSTKQVRPLLPGGHHCAVLITSRRRLSGLSIRSSARHLQLARLPISSAADMLAGLIGEDDAEQSPRLTRLAELLDCLPLAIHAAAELVHAHGYGLGELIAVMEGPTRLQALDLAADDDPEASLSAALNASAQHLSADATALLIELAHRGDQMVDALPVNERRELLREKFLVPGDGGVQLPSLVAEWAKTVLGPRPVHRPARETTATADRDAVETKPPRRIAVA